MLVVAGALLCLAAATLAQEPQIQTSVVCHFYGAWSDVCRYENVCFNGAPTNLVFISNTPQHIKGMLGRPKGGTPIHASTKLFRVRAAAVVTSTCLYGACRRTHPQCRYVWLGVCVACVRIDLRCVLPG
jgi:hypothetical protein